MRTIYRSEPPWPHRILVLGGGFAGVETARHLERRTRRREDVEIWVVSRENFSLFTPLLPEVCSGHLEARHCVTALRALLRRPSSWAVTAVVERIDLDAKQVIVLGGDGDLHRLNYDTLVIALGGETATFGIKGITEFAVGMKTLADAFALRNRIIEVLERADLEEDPEERRAQLTFVVGGAGFSGVETAGEIEDFVRRVRRRYYPKIRADELRFHIVELKDRVLPEMPTDMGDYAARKLRQRGFEIHLGTPMQEVREDRVTIGDGTFIPSRTVIWTGGVQPSPIVREAGIEVDRAGRAIVDATMATSREGIWAIGDCALIPNVDEEGSYHAPTAQNAVREAKRLAANIVATIDRRPAEVQPFRYDVIGTLASIGAHTGVGIVFGIKVRGWLAWFMWRGYYWSRVPGIGGKARVALDWFLTTLFGSDPVQLKVDYPGARGMGPSGTRRPARRTVDPRGVTLARLRTMSREERRAYQRQMRGMDRSPSLPPAARARAERNAAKRAQRAEPKQAAAFSRSFWIRSILIAIAGGFAGFSLAWGTGMPTALYVGLAVAAVALLVLVGMRYLQRRAAAT